MSADEATRDGATRDGAAAATRTLPWTATVLTLFPEMFPGHLGASLAGKALERGLWALRVLDIRDFARDKHRSVDDAPFGGGAGMVMRPDVVDAALEAAKAQGQAAKAQGLGPAIYLSPRGRLLTQALVRELAAGPGAGLLCGRYEGVDERVLEAHGVAEVSLGDYVLSGGEPAALAIRFRRVRLGEIGRRGSVAALTMRNCSPICRCSRSAAMPDSWLRASRDS